MYYLKFSDAVKQQYQTEELIQPFIKKKKTP